MNKILILSPHTDDAEVGCGGTISKLIREGYEIYVMVFSAAFPSESYIVKNKDTNPQILFDELKESMKTLGVPEKNLDVWQFQVRYLYTMRQDILNNILKLKKKIEPDLVFLPCQDDIHQDHQVIYKEGLRAFKTTSILGYEYPWNNINSKANCFFKITEEDLKKKIMALSHYKTQYGRPYLEPDFIVSWAKVNGVKVETKYAEAFETIRWIK